MNDDLDLDLGTAPVDERARRAATDLRSRSGARARPPFDTDAVAPQHRPSGRILAAAAVLVVLVGAFAWVALRPGDRPGADDDPATVVSGDPRPFVAGALPEGFTSMGASTISRSDLTEPFGGQTGPMVVYGPSPDDAQLGLARFPTWTDDDATERAIDVDGTRAFDLGGLGMGTHAVAVRDGDGALLAMSPTLDEETLVQLLEDASVAGETVTVDPGDDALPAEWEELGRAEDLMAALSPALASSPVVGNNTMYGRGMGSEATSMADVGVLTVTSSLGEPEQVTFTGLALEDVERVEVRDHDAVIGSTPRPTRTELEPTWTVSWMERPGELVQVTGTGISRDEVLAVAEGVVPATPAEFTDLLERTELQEFDPQSSGPDGSPKVAEGRTDDEIRWLMRGRVTDDEGIGPSLSVDLALTLDGGSESRGWDGHALIDAEGQGTRVALQVVDGEDASYVGVLLSDPGDRVELRDAEGAVVLRPDLVPASDGRRATVARLPSDTATIAIVAADGTVVAEVSPTQD